jgi:hypothetical protein
VSDRLALANAIEDAGIERSKAERVASVIVDLVHDTAAAKGDVQASEAATKAAIQASEASVRALLASETNRLDTRIERLDATVKAQPNAIMLRLGTLMVVLTGIILAALRYLPSSGHG